MKSKFLLTITSMALAAGISGVAYAGKSDDTLNVAIDRELESIDNYYNTAREGIVISRMVWTRFCIAMLQPMNIFQTSPPPTSGWTRKQSNLICARV